MSAQAVSTHAPDSTGITKAERDIYDGIAPYHELGCPLSEEEQALFDELNARPMLPFSVTATRDGHPPEHINIMARTSCDAAVQVMQLLFFDSGDCITTGFKIRVVPIRRQAAR